MAEIFQVFPPGPVTVPILDITIAEQAAYFGQLNQHVIAWYRVLYDHGRDKYRPGDEIRV